MAQLSLDSKIVRLPDLIASEMDGDLVMMSIESGQYFGVTGAGLRVWQLLEQPIRLEQVVAHIVEEFEVDEATCLQDMQAFAEDLLTHRVVKLC